MIRSFLLSAACCSNAGLSLQKDVQELDTQISTGDIATVNQLKSYINTAFGNPQQDQQAVRVISRMIDLSQTIRVNNMGTLEGMTEAPGAAAACCRPVCAGICPEYQRYQYGSLGGDHDAGFHSAGTH